MVSGYGIRYSVDLDPNRLKVKKRCLSYLPLLSSQDRKPLGHLRVQVAGGQQDEGARMEQPLPPKQDHGTRLRAQEVGRSMEHSLPILVF